jgi:hypothetical protein
VFTSKKLGNCPDNTVFFDDPIKGIHWELAWLPKVPTPRQVWSFYRAIRERAGSRADLAKTAPGLTWQASECFSVCSTTRSAV